MSFISESITGRQFLLNKSFTSFWLIYHIVKLQIYSFLHSTLIVTKMSKCFYVSWLVSQLTLCRHSAAWADAYAYAFAYASAWTTSPPKLQGLETCCFFKKIPYLSRMKNCSRHANLSVRLFARDITRGVPPPKVWKFQHLITIFSVTIAGISLISCIYVLGQR